MPWPMLREMSIETCGIAYTSPAKPATKTATVLATREMNWPFVSRERFIDRERQILDLKRELADIKHAYMRVVDEINFRSSGFHLDERFVKKEDSTAVVPQVKEEEPTGISRSIAQVGTRMTALRQHLEMSNVSQLEKAEQEARAAREVQMQAEAARRLEEALQAGKQKVQA